MFQPVSAVRSAGLTRQFGLKQRSNQYNYAEYSGNSSFFIHPVFPMKILSKRDCQCSASFRITLTPISSDYFLFDKSVFSKD